MARMFTRICGSAAALLLAAASTAAENPVPGALPAAGTYKLERIMTAPDGKVLNIDGTEHRLSSFVTGKVTLLTFMYTSCADADGCPLAYGVLRALKRSLDAMPGMKQSVRFVSLSFDPAHDTPDVMRSYGGDNARDVKGLPWYFLTTRSTLELKPLLNGLDQDLAVAVDKGGPASLGHGPGMAHGTSTIMMSHLLKVFLIDTKGQVREIYTNSFLKPDVLQRDIETLLLESQRR